MDGTPDIYPGNGTGRAGSGTGDGTGTACDYALYDVFSAVSFANASSSEGGLQVRLISVSSTERESTQEFHTRN